MKYLIVMNGRGTGCDYTIGCNMKYKEVESTPEKIKQECIEKAMEYSSPDVVKLMYVPMEHVIDLTSDLILEVTKREQEEKEEARRSQVAKELAELERLQAKYKKT